MLALQVAKTLKDVPLVEAGLVQLKESGAVSKYNRYGTTALPSIFNFHHSSIFPTSPSHTFDKAN